mgnify:CR=1 FL=1
MDKTHIVSEIRRYDQEKIRFLRERIQDFQVIILYDREKNAFNHDYLLTFPSKNLKEKISGNQIFPRIKSQTFIIWQEAYDENRALFYKLRLRARTEMHLRLTEFMVAKYFSKHEKLLNEAFQKNTISKWQLLNDLFHKYEVFIEKNTKIKDETTWELFSQWFKHYLSENIIEELLIAYPYHQLAAMPEQELNQLFFNSMNHNFSENSLFMNKFIQVVNNYLSEWMTSLFDHAINDTAMIPEVKAIEATIKFKRTIEEHYLIVMSNLLYQSVVEVISNQGIQKRVNNYYPDARIDHPYLQAVLQYRNDDEHYKELSELEVDLLDILCHFILSKTDLIDAVVSVKIDDILRIRNLKEKLGGAGRRGGFDAKQRASVLKALSFIQGLWVVVDSLKVYEKGQQVEKQLAGELFNFTDAEGEPLMFSEAAHIEAFELSIGTVFKHHLTGTNRQIKLLSKEVIMYNPYQKSYEKKLGRYLNWRWRTQARKGSFLQPHKVSTLLDKLSLEEKGRAPSRIRDRLEKALDQLADDGIIRFWHYENWDEKVMAKKGWLEKWKNTTLRIGPPNEVEQYYKNIGKKK